MQENESMCVKILTDLQSIINNDEDLVDFCIVTLSPNEKNKSPILYEDHHLALESWCIKHVYKQAYLRLFKFRKSLESNKLTLSSMLDINKYLIGVILIQPDVSTFWNMKRELVERRILDINKELLFSKLVLSFKHKSNEAFMYRKWLLMNHFKSNNILKNDEIIMENNLRVLQEEFVVCERTADKAQNNYHAWTHRIWSLQTILPKPASSVILSQLDFSYKWITTHISEHTGFHFRQYIIKLVKSTTIDKDTLCKYYNYIKDYLSQNYECYSLLDYILSNKSAKCITPQNYLCLLLYELTETLKTLHELYSDHECIWYHRRYIIYGLLQVVSNYSVILPNDNSSSEHLTSKNVSMQQFEENLNIKHFEDNGEIKCKLFKFEDNDSHFYDLYKLVLGIEKTTIKENLECKNELKQKYAKRHQNWLQLIMGIKVEI